MIEVKHIEKRFKDQRVLQDVSISFEAGKIYGIIGRNGSGKTVFMKIICGLLRPEKGIPYLSGYENLRNLSRIRNEISERQIRETLKTVGLEEAAGKKVSKYSLGMKQRLGIAQAIMENPRYLVLDEPMNGLDKEGVEEVRKLLLKLKREGRTILLASHNREDIALLCDEVYEMDKGILEKCKKV